jgi:hypothetical protein
LPGRALQKIGTRPKNVFLIVNDYLPLHKT